MQISAQIALILWLFVAGTIPATARAQGISPTPEAAAIVHPVYPTGSATALGQQIEALLADPSVARAHWGIAVTALDGTPIYGVDEGKLFRPASNNKIFTTATAMGLLGPGKTFDTRVFGRLDAATGTVSGDLTLVGGGDANFGADDLPYVSRLERARQMAGAPPKSEVEQPPALADLAALVDQLVAKGRQAGDGGCCWG